MPGLYRTISDTIQTLWGVGWAAHSDVPAYWRNNDPDVFPDPSTSYHFMRNEIEFGRERLMAYGEGRMLNERSQFGSIVITVWTSRALQNEDVALDLMADAMAIYRSVKVGELSFIGEGGGFITGPSEDGNWFVRGAIIVFEYRFIG